MVRILTAILKRIARVAKAANDKLAILTKEQAISDNEVPIFSYVDRSFGAVGLSFVNAIPINLEDGQALPAIMVRIFWNGIRVEPVVDHGRQLGTTWIELFALFAINGGTALVQNKANNHLRVKFLDEFARFKSSV